MIANEGLFVGIPDPKNVSCHPGGDDCILGGGVDPKYIHQENIRTSDWLEADRPSTNHPTSKTFPIQIHNYTI